MVGLDLEREFAPEHLLTFDLDVDSQGAGCERTGEGLGARWNS